MDIHRTINENVSPVHGIFTHLIVNCPFSHSIAKHKWDSQTSEQQRIQYKKDERKKSPIIHMHHSFFLFLILLASAFDHCLLWGGLSKKTFWTRPPASPSGRSHLPLPDAEGWPWLTMTATLISPTGINLPADSRPLLPWGLFILSALTSWCQISLRHAELCHLRFCDVYTHSLCRNDNVMKANSM